MPVILAAPPCRLTQVKTKANQTSVFFGAVPLDDDQTDIVQFTQREFRSVENIAHVSATQNAIPLIFQCHDPAPIFIPDTIAQTVLNVVPSGHHLKSHAVPSPARALIKTIRKLAPSVPS